MTFCMKRDEVCSTGPAELRLICSYFKSEVFILLLSG